jgi:hypothetical protein
MKMSGMPGPKKLKRANLALSRFKKATFSKKIKGRIFYDNLPKELG